MFEKTDPPGGGGYHTLGRLTRRGIIPVRLRKIQITKVENMLTYWSMVQAGSNEVENLVGQSLQSLIGGGPRPGLKTFDNIFSKI